MTVYLDHNATSPIRPEARAAMLAALDAGGNPSSVHGRGRAARATVEKARAILAGALCAKDAGCAISPEGVVFTAGGTEADNLAVASAVASGSTRLLVSAIEHPAVLASARASGADVELIPVRRDGTVDLAWLKDRLSAWDTADGPPFAAVMLANNETGVIQPVADAAEMVHAAGGRLLTDAVQALGKIDVDLDALGADWLTLSAHKLGGPQGVGALVVRDGTPVARQIHGGGQERGSRAGTENVAGIAGFGAAVEAALADRATMDGLAALRDSIAEQITAARPDAVVFGAEAPRLANTVCFALPGFSAETQVMALDLAGFAVSSGSACSSGKVKPSHVLAAMGASEEEASCALRVSLGWNTTPADADAFARAWIDAAERARPRAVA